MVSAFLSPAFWKFKSLSQVAPKLRTRGPFTQSKILKATWFLVLSILTALASEQALKENAIDDWLKEKAPKASFWRTFTRGTSLHEITSVDTQELIFKHFPHRSAHEPKIWWNQKLDLLIVNLNPAESALPLFFSTASETGFKKENLKKESLEWHSLGESWNAVEPLETLISSLKIKPSSIAKVKNLKTNWRHPKEWVIERK